MASKPAVRSLQSLARISRPVCECANGPTRGVAFRQMSTGTFTPMKAESTSSGDTAAPRSESMTESKELPRWAKTPPRMKAPFPFRIKDTTTREWKCNEDPQKLDRFYAAFLGRGGDGMLTEEVKWLAVTHKSFDQGRRGFNDRLAFLGRRIINLQLNLALLNSAVATKMQRAPMPNDTRQPYKHPALSSLQNVSDVPIEEVLTKQRLSGLATNMGMREIVRWVPRNVRNLESSGIDVVLTSSIYAIIGALSLQRGGAVAAEFAREKVLKPLGIS